MLEFAKTPPKGWNSWDVYGASVTEEEVKRNADIMAEKLKVYGWDYVVVDIQWYEPGAESAAYRKFADLKMDEYSRVLPAENRFPSSADGIICRDRHIAWENPIFQAGEIDVWKFQTFRTM